MSVNEMDTNEPLFFVIFPEDGVWVAHGLQHNVVTSGKTLPQVKANLEAVFRLHVQRKTLDLVPEANAELWKRFAYALRYGKTLDEAISQETVQGALTYEMPVAA